MKDNAPAEKAFRTALGAVCIFAGVHTVMCLLTACFLPGGPPWTFVFLGLEAAAAAAAFVLCAAALIWAVRRRLPALGGFAGVFRSLRDPSFYLAAAWCIWSFIACALAIRRGLGGLYNNVRYLFYLAASLLVLFPLGCYMGRENKRAPLHLLYDVCLGFFCVFILYGFYRFLRGDMSFTAIFDRVYRFNRARVRFGQNANATGAYCVFFLVMGVYRMTALKKNLHKALLALALLPLLTACALTSSRSAILSGGLACGFLAGETVYRRREKKGLSSLLPAAGAFVLATGLILGCFYGLRALLLILKKQLVLFYAATGAKKAADSRDILDTLTDLNGRGVIWRSVILCLKKDPRLLLYGCTQSSTVKTVEELMGKSVNTHNQLLEVLLAYGLPALALFVAWLICTAGKSLALGLDTTAEDGRWMLPATLLFLVANNMTETMLVARGHFTGCFFFLIAGYVCGMAKKKPKQAREESLSPHSPE